MEDSKENIFNIPNLLTFFRMAAGVLFVLMLFSGYSNFNLFLVFLLGGITDFFDGILARKLNQTTKIGQFLDVIADRTIFAAALFSLAIYSIYDNYFIYFSSNLLGAILLLVPREIFGTIGVAVSLLEKKPLFVSHNFLNKLTGFMQYVTLALIILNLRISFYSAAVTFAIGTCAGLNYIKKSLEQRY